jgi:hypothetical protein
MLDRANDVLERADKLDDAVSLPSPLISSATRSSRATWTAKRCAQ